MNHTKHSYRDKLQGRSFKIDLSTRQKKAFLHCGCGSIGELKMKAIMPPDLIDKKFQQMGWELDPHACPECVQRTKDNRRAAKAAPEKIPPTNTVPLQAGGVTTNKAHEPKKEQNTMAEQLKPISADVHKASAKMHALLATHFDADEGRFDPDWTDERVAKESGLAADHVTMVRDIAYGVLKEPEEFNAIRTEIKSLTDLVNETLITAQREVNNLDKRINMLAKDLGFKPSK